MGRFWQLAKRLGGRLAISVRHWLGWAFFTLSCLAAMVLCLAILLQQVAGDKPSAAVISAAGGIVLVAALFARHGEVIAARLKKLGPLELFEEVREALANLEDITSKVPVYTVSDDKLELESASLSPQERFAFNQGDLFAAMPLLRGTEPKHSAAAAQRRYFELLYKVGGCALSQKQWPRATARLERLEELSGSAYKQRKVLYMSGVAYWNWGREESEKAERRHYFEKARDQLKKLIDLGNAPAAAYFFLAYAQDELKQWHEAVESNREMLERRPRSAPAKYNSAISMIKLDRLSDAYKMLGRMTVDDDELDIVLAVYKEDPDLQPRWLQDAYWRRSIMLRLRNLEQEWNDRRTSPASR